LPLGEPAHNLNLFSALCGALAVGLVAALAGVASRHACDCGRMANHGHCGAGATAAMALPPLQRPSEVPTAVGVAPPCHRTRRSLCTACGCVAGGLSFAAVPSFW